MASSGRFAGFDLNSRLDAVNVLGLNGYDLLTLAQSLAFHAAALLCLPPLAPLYPLLFLVQLGVAAWAYRAYSPYVDAKEGGKRGLYRFSLRARPDSSEDLQGLADRLSAPASPVPLSPLAEEGEGDEEGVKVQAEEKERVRLPPPPSSSVVRDVTSPTASSAASPVRSPHSRQRRLSASETIDALKKPLLHNTYAHNTAATTAGDATATLSNASALGGRQQSAKRKLSAFQSIALQTLNPFVNKTWKISHHEHVRLSLATAFLLPFRALLMLLLFLVGYAIAKASTWGLTLDDVKAAPLRGWRRALLRLLQLFVRLFLVVLGYVWIGEKGVPASRDEAPVVVCNHISVVEPVILLARYLCSPVGAEETLMVPMVGVICQALQCVTVRRKERSSRGDLIRELKRRAAPGSGWPQVMVYPEGTTTNGQALITFKAGAFIPMAPVQPVAVRFPSGSRVNPAWVSCGPGPLQLLLRLLCEPFSRAYVEYLPVHRPSAAELADANLYASNVRDSIAAALQVPTTNHSYEDALLAEAAWTSPLYRQLADTDRRNTTSVELSALQTLAHIDAPSALLHLKRFTALDVRGVGRLNYEELRAGLGMADTPEMVALFAAMDEQESGEIDFREYLMGLACVQAADAPHEQQLLSRESSDGSTGAEKLEAAEEMKVRLLCRMLDVEDHRLVNVDDVTSVLSRADLEPAHLASHIATLSHGADGAARRQVSVEELQALLRADGDMREDLTRVLFAALPTEAVRGQKVEAAAAVVAVEAKSWRKKLRERVKEGVRQGVSKVKRRFS